MQPMRVNKKLFRLVLPITVQYLKPSHHCSQFTGGHLAGRRPSAAWPMAHPRVVAWADARRSPPKSGQVSMVSFEEYRAIPMIEKQFGIEILPTWHGTRAGNPETFKREVRVELTRVLRSDAGQALARSLRFHGKTVYLMPYEGQD